MTTAAHRKEDENDKHAGITKEKMRKVGSKAQKNARKSYSRRP